MPLLWCHLMPKDLSRSHEQPSSFTLLHISKWNLFTYDKELDKIVSGHCNILLYVLNRKIKMLYYIKKLIKESQKWIQCFFSLSKYAKGAYHLALSKRVYCQHIFFSILQFMKNIYTSVTGLPNVLIGLTIALYW